MSYIETGIDFKIAQQDTNVPSVPFHELNYVQPPSFPDIQIPAQPISDNTSDNLKTDRSRYLTHIDRLVDWSKKTFNYVSQKLQAQNILQTAGIGEYNTFLVQATDIAGADYVVDGFLDAGRTPVWIGTCINNDHADQQRTSQKSIFVPSREQAKFWRGIHTRENWEKLKPIIQKYSKQHDELILKIFPQDGNYSIGRLLTLNDDGMIIQVRLKQMNGRDDQKIKNKQVNIIIKLNDDTKKISVSSNDPEEAKFLLEILAKDKSLRYFQQLQQTTERLSPSNLSLLNPEFMLDTTKHSIAFFTDIIFGTGPKAKTTDLPNISQMLEKAVLAEISLMTEPEPAKEEVKNNIFRNTYDKRVYPFNNINTAEFNSLKHAE